MCCIINPTKIPTFSSFHPLSHALTFYTIHTSYTYTYTFGGKEMKDRMERFVILPFSLGCSTQSSVAVATSHQHKKQNQLIKRREKSDENGSFKKECTKMDSNGANISDEGREESDDNGSFKKEYTKMDNTNNGANISDGIYRIIRSFKSFSHFFIRYDEETKEREAEMEIGFPTDVKHLSHIGVDGTMTTFDVSSSSFPFANFHLTAV